MLFIFFKLSLNHLFVSFVFFEIFQRVYLNCIHCVYIRADGIFVLVIYSGETVHGCPYPLVVIRREISVRNSC